MAPSKTRMLPKHEVFVEIPPAPFATPRRKQESTTSARRALVPVVEIPYSPLWRGKQSASQASKPTPKPIVNRMYVEIPSRPLPLSDKNARLGVRGEPDTSLKKRKAQDEPVSNGLQKKPRVENVVPQPQKLLHPPAIVGPPRLASVTNVVDTVPRKRGRPPKGTTVTKPIRATASAPAIGAETQAIIPKPIVRRPRKLKPDDIPKFVRLDGFDSKTEVENRILIREFFHRFTALMDFPKTHRDALDDFSILPEQTLKQMLIHLFDLIHADAQPKLQKVLHAAKAELRKSNPNPTYLWKIIRGVKDNAPDLHIAEPLGMADAIVNRRSEQRVGSSNDMIPTVLSLIEAVITSASVREDLTAGIEENQSTRSKAAETTKAEKARWEEEKSGLKALRDKGVAEETEKDKFDLAAWKEEFKSLETKHKQVLRQEHLKLMERTSSNGLRWTTAGLDMDGRQYHILSTPPNGAKPPSDGEREVMRRWAWFVAVWVDSPIAGSLTEEEGWYGVYEPKEIRKLVKWLEWRKATQNATGANHNDLTVQGSASTLTDDTTDLDTGFQDQYRGADLKPLCKNLFDLADFIEWRAGGRKASAITI